MTWTRRSPPAEDRQAHVAVFRLTTIRTAPSINLPLPLRKSTPRSGSSADMGWTELRARRVTWWLDTAPLERRNDLAGC